MKENNDYWLIKDTPYIDFEKIYNMDWIIAVIISGRNQGKRGGSGDTFSLLPFLQKKHSGMEKYTKSSVL